MTVYIDVLLALNLYINYFLVRGAAVILNRDVKTTRIFAAAAVGALFSLTILLPELPFIANVLIRTLSGAVIVLIAFGFSGRAEFIIDMLCFLVISFLYAGLMGALWQYGAPLGMYFRNGSAYFNVPLIAVAVMTAVAYGVIRFLRYLCDKRTICTQTQEVVISANGVTVKLHGTPDSGNSLCDPFSGTPVVICEITAVDEIIPENIRAYLSGNISGLDGIRLVPCRTVGGSTLIPVFRADSVLINGKRVSVMIGVSRNEMGVECIFDPRLM